MGRTRQIRVFGVLTMAVGLSLLPAAAAQAAPPTDDGHKVTICHRTNSVTNPYVEITVDYDAADGATGKGNNDHTHHLGPVFDFDADPVVAYPTPRNGDQWGDIIPPYTYETGSFPGLNWDEAGQAVWNADCGAPEVEPVLTTLTIDKVVAGDAAPQTWSFPFTGLSGGFELTDAVPATGAEIIDPDTPYVITETDTGGADSTDVDCTDAVVIVDGASATVTVAEGAAAVCTFTNTFDPEVVPQTGSVTITKAATGEAPDDWSFPFDGGALGTFDLTDDAPSTTFDELTAGVYVIDETDAGEADLTLIDCGDADAVVEIADDASSGLVTVTLAEGEDVLCTFTNDFAEVLDNTVVRVPQTTPTSEPEVLGSVVRAPTLPNTGAGATILAAVGALLLSAGACLTFGARHLETVLVDRR